MCKEAGRVFKICSQVCLDKCWPTHKQAHVVVSAQGEQREAPSSPHIRAQEHNGHGPWVSSINSARGAVRVISDVVQNGGEKEVFGAGQGAMGQLASAGEQELETYRQVVRMATMENALTPQKLKMLADMRQQLHISETQHLQVLTDLYIGADEWNQMKEDGWRPPPSLPCYIIFFHLLRFSNLLCYKGGTKLLPTWPMQASRNVWFVATRPQITWFWTACTCVYALIVPRSLGAPSPNALCAGARCAKSKRFSFDSRQQSLRLFNC